MCGFVNFDNVGCQFSSAWHVIETLNFMKGTHILIFNIIFFKAKFIIIYYCIALYQHNKNDNWHSN